MCVCVYVYVYVLNVLNVLNKITTKTRFDIHSDSEIRIFLIDKKVQQKFKSPIFSSLLIIPLIIHFSSL